ncbi:hypothetical protein [Streptomyces sp. SD31]|uniref:hypothetical protein n=1 Tax=Streptomyces sp. SD31 TaxID=3452208 RepID=UPI003F8BCE02
MAIRHERAAFAAAGLDVRHQRLADCYQDAGRLLAALQKSHGHGDDTDAMTALLKRQADAMATTPEWSPPTTVPSTAPS